ncbi:MAG: DUF493 domain-containing protein [Deltaproteobacteria bacterium]|nr:DUF493 domain-containing protein [Deltaproteobacteria bacterium]
MEEQEAVDLLNQCHSFPGLYVFKVIGENTSLFYEGVLEEIRRELGQEVEEGRCLSVRESSGRRYLSMTLRLEMESAEQVLRLYGRFSKLEGLKTVL